MMHEMSFIQFIENYFLIILLLSFSYAVGWLYFSTVLQKRSFIKTSNIFIHVAEKSIFGITIIISSIAMFYTKGMTVQIITLITLVILVFVTRKIKQIEHLNYIKPSWKDFLIFFIISFLLYLFHYYSYHLPDFVFYGKLSQSLVDVKDESILSLYNSYGVSQQMSLYHFGELWLNGVISKILSINSIFSLKNIVYPFFHIITFVIIIGIVSLKIRNRWMFFFFSFGLLYGSSILFYPLLSPEQGHYTFWFYGLPDITSFKTLLIYPFFLFALFYLIEEKWMPFLSIILITAVHFFTTWIGITGALLMLLIYLILIKEYKDIFKISLYIFFLSILFILPSFFNQITSGSIEIIHHIYPISHYFKNSNEYLMRFINYLSRPFILYPFVLIGILFGYKSFTNADKTVLLFIFFCIVSSVFFITFFFSIRESTQALSNILAPLMIFASYLCWKKLNYKNQLIFSIFLCVFAVLNMFNTYLYSDGKILRTEFEKKIYEFSQRNLQHQNWAYYSEKYWSKFAYNGNIVSSPMLLPQKTIMPIEVAPVFDAGSEDFYKKNPNYPLIDIHNSIPGMLRYFKKYSIQYIYIENIDIVPKELKKYLIPVIINDFKGVYKIEFQFK